MPIQYPNFSADPNAVPNIPGWKGFIENLQKGYEVSQLPEQMRNQKYMRDLAIKKAQLENMYYGPRQEAELKKAEQENEYYPQMQRAQIENLQAQTAKASQPENPFSDFTGDVGNAYKLEQLKLAAQKNPALMPAYNSAREAYQTDLDAKRSLMDYRSTLNQYAGKKTSSPLGKLYSELAEVEEGNVPGTNGEQKLTPEQQNDLRNKYELDIQKKTTDVKTRERNLFIQNLDKTLATIDAAKLTQYSGVKGNLEKTQEEFLSQFGKQSKKYDEYLKNITSATIAAKQLRQFLGDSVQPGVQKELDALTNPSTWKKNPEQAKMQFDRFVEIYNKEKATYQSALKRPIGSKDEEEEDYSKYNDEELDKMSKGIPLK